MNRYDKQYYSIAYPYGRADKIKDLTGYFTGLRLPGSYHLSDRQLKEIYPNYYFILRLLDLEKQKNGQLRKKLHEQKQRNHSMKNKLERYEGRFMEFILKPGITTCRDCKYWRSLDGKPGVCTLHNFYTVSAYYCADAEVPE